MFSPWGWGEKYKELYKWVKIVKHNYDPLLSVYIHLTQKYLNDAETLLLSFKNDFILILLDM